MKSGVVAGIDVSWIAALWAPPVHPLRADAPWIVIPHYHMLSHHVLLLYIYTTLKRCGTQLILVSSPSLCEARPRPGRQSTLMTRSRSIIMGMIGGTVLSCLHLPTSTRQLQYQCKIRCKGVHPLGTIIARTALNQSLHVRQVWGSIGGG